MKERMALATRETRRRKPIPRTIVNESTRLRTKVLIPIPCLAGDAFQTRFIVSCSWTNTPVAPRKSPIPPMSAAHPPVFCLRVLLMSSCTAAAPLSPMRRPSERWTSPRAASSPKAAPAMAMAMSSMGAMEKAV